MNRLINAVINLVYILYLIILSAAYELALPLYLLVFLILRKGRLDDAFRAHNWFYGRYVVKASWPYVRTSVYGADNIPAGQPCVFVLNHRSYIDIFFSALIPRANQLVIVRSWVFNLKIFSWAMRLAHYLNIDKTNREEFYRVGREYARRGVSFQFYPEGHRSRDGRLRRFRTGAFVIAVQNDLPVVPVIMTGTNDYANYQFPWLHPARVEMTILPPVYPRQFSGDLRARQMCRHVENIFREHLDE